MLHWGYGQMKDGLYEEAIETFSAAQALDENDERPTKAREMLRHQLESIRKTG